MRGTVVTYRTATAAVLGIFLLVVVVQNSPAADLQEAEEHFQRGVEAYQRGDLSAAIDQWQQALEIYRKLPGTRQNQAACLGNLGAAYGHLGQHQRQIELTQQALEIYRKLPGTEKEQAGCLLNLGDAYGDFGQPQRMIELTQQALEIYRRLPGTEEDEADCLFNLSLAYGQLGQHQVKLELTEQALGIYRKLAGAERQQADCLLNLGCAYSHLGRHERQLALTQEALEIYRKVPATEKDQAGCLHNLGVGYGDLGQHQRQIELTQQALEIYRKLPGTEKDQAGCLFNLGQAYGDLGQPQRQIELTQQALEIYRELPGAERDQAGCLLNLGVALREVGDFSGALMRFSEASRMFRRYARVAAGAEARWLPEEMYRVEAGIGETYWRRGQEGDLYRAYQHYARAIRIIEHLRARAATAPELKASYFAHMVWVYDEMIELLMEMKEKGLRPDRSLLEGEDDGLWADLGLEVPQLWPGWGGWEEAMLYYNEGQHARVLQDLMANTPVAFADAKVRLVWLDLNQALADQEKLAEEVVRAEGKGESERVSALQERFSDVSRRRRQLELQFAASAFARAVQARPLSLRQIQALLGPEEAIVEYKVLVDRLLILVVTPAGLRAYTVATCQAGYHEVSALLGRDEESRAGDVLLDYLEKLRAEKAREEKLPQGMLAIVGPEELIENFTIPELVWLYRYPMQLVAEGRGEEDPSRAGTRPLIIVPKEPRSYLPAAGLAGAQQVAVSRALYRLLLGPIEQDLSQAGIKSLIIVPDGPLYYLPMAGLIAAAPEDLQAQAVAGQVYAHPGVQYALEKWQISYLPSVSMYAGMLEAARGRPEPAKTLCAFADPVFSEHDPRAGQGGRVRMTGLAVTGDEVLDAFARYMRGLEGGEEKGKRGLLVRLPNTALEAQKALEAFGGGRQYTRPQEVVWPRGGSVALLALAPIEPYAYVKDLSAYGYVLLSTHGVIRPDDAMRSYIALTAPRAAGLSGEEAEKSVADGRLMLNEAFGLQLNARMVTLSACETAEGDYEYGEGIIGLTAAFFVSGARGLTASVWRVDDAATAQLIGRYHELMAKGTGPAAALRQAQLELLAQARQAYHQDPTSHTTALSHPYFWSPFLPIGQWR